MGEIFQQFAGQFFDLGFYSMDLTFVFCTVALLGAFDKSARTLACRLRDFAVLLAVEGALCFIKYLLTSNSGSLPVFALILCGYALRQQDIRTTDKIVRCTTFMAALILLIGITGVLAPALTFLRSIPYGSVLPNVFSFAVLLGIAVFLRRYSVSRFPFVPRDYANLLVGICIISSVAGWCFIRFNGTQELTTLSSETAETASAIYRDISAVNLVVDAGFLVLLLISYRMFYLLSKEHERRGANLVIRRQASDNVETIDVTRTVYEQMRDVRHETRNRVAYMQALLKAKDYQRLEEYFGSFQQETEGFLTYVQSGNATIDAVVNAKIALAKSKGIEVKTMLAVPQQLSFREEDLYSVVANLMDNAIEGVEVSGTQDKWIKLSIRPEGGYYVVTVQNPCAHREDATGSLSRLKTTKVDKEVHGYGTRLVSRIARRHKGTARYQVSDDVFTVNVMLAQEESVQKEERA